MSPRRWTSSHAALRDTGAVLAALVDAHGFDVVWRSALANRISRAAHGSREAMLAAVSVEPAFTLDPLAGLNLTEISVLYEYLLAHVSHDDRKASGQFFTPDDVAQFMAGLAAEFEPGERWIDPCCGVGNLSYWLAAAQEDPERFVRDQLVLVDSDPLALLSARILLTLAFERSEIGLFERLSARSHHLDSLIDELPEFDFAIMNPPYVVVPADRSFRSGNSRDLYAYFLERMILHGRGFVAITPQSFTGGRKFRELRVLLLEHVSRFDIFCFDNVPDNIFRGIKFGSQNSNRVNSTRAAVTVARRDGVIRRRITPLLRWRAAERGTMFSNAHEYLAPLVEDAASFRKIDPALLDFYKEVSRADRTIGDMLSPSGAYTLTVGSTPRYYVSAVERPINRRGMHILRFATQVDRDIAYIVLNSSLAYWWWRIHDGGITLNRGVLRAVPIPRGLSVSGDLLEALRESERANLVVKRNAGQDQENVKHPESLVRRLNHLVAPHAADSLTGVHQNSYFGDSARSLVLASSM